VIFVLAGGVVEHTGLRCTLNASGRLVNVNVCDASFVLVFLQVQYNGSQADSFTCKPPDSLKGEYRFNIIGESLVLLE
jgi:hypothetical protein